MLISQRIRLDAPHDVIFTALQNYGTDQDFITMVRNIYRRSSMRMVMEEGLNEKVLIRRKKDDYGKETSLTWRKITSCSPCKNTTIPHKR
ncbi:hypothetical protein NPIL_277611 [Nephila pilipes]|uniref:Uncharacterized protein n=1 Tax=Nephila pilipes TaxID=299642 RepID=A0A8X6P9P8_NEPPI|nr:hypothetical protein NPIL_277611 [Nephila pilipes]